MAHRVAAYPPVGSRRPRRHLPDAHARDLLRFPQNLLVGQLRGPRADFELLQDAHRLRHVQRPDRHGQKRRLEVRQHARSKGPVEPLVRHDARYRKLGFARRPRRGLDERRGRRRPDIRSVLYRWLRQPHPAPAQSRRQRHRCGNPNQPGLARMDPIALGHRAGWILCLHLAERRQCAVGSTAGVRRLRQPHRILPPALALPAHHPGLGWR